MARRTVIMPVGARERVAGSQLVVQRRRVLPPAAVGPTITAPGSLSGGPAFRIGALRTITAGVALPSGGGTISYQFRWLVDGASAATVAVYTPLAGNDGDPIVAQWRAVETGGTSPGETPWQTVGSGTITYAPPTFSTQPAFSAASYTIGQTMTFTEGVAGPAAVLTVEEFRLDAVDKRGELSGTSWNTTGEAPGTITLRIRATNSGGSVLSNSITATLAAAAPAPQIIYSAGTGWVPHVVSDDAAGDLTFTLTVDGVTLGPFVRTMAQKTSGEAVNHVLPVIAVTTPAGTYAATTGIWTHGQSAATVASYQWRRDGVTISGATSATYATVGADAGTTLTCAVTVAGVSAVSNGIAIPAAGAGITVAGATDGITFTSTSDLTVTGGTNGITATEA